MTDLNLQTREPLWRQVYEVGLKTSKSCGVQFRSTPRGSSELDCNVPIAETLLSSSILWHVIVYRERFKQKNSVH